MFIHPVLIDARPAYFEAAGSPDSSYSLLLLPTGRGPLVRSLLRPLASLGEARPIVLTTFEPTPEYLLALREACPSALVLHSAHALEAHVASLDPSERLLLVDAAFYPHGGFTPELFAQLAEGPNGVAHHLLVLDAAPEGTKEYVQEDGEGRVRRIQRYYYPVTWPFASGVACSLVPVAAFLPLVDPPFASLVELRRALGAAGSPSRDVPLSQGAIDLRGEDGVLSLVEQFAMSATRRASRSATPARGSHALERDRPNTRIASTARLIGPVLIEDGVEIDDDAVVIGPSLLCAGARIGRRAVVAQCLVMPGTAVPPAESRRHRVVAAVAAGPLDAPPAPRAHASRHAGAVTPAVEPAGPLYPAVKAVVESAIAFALLAALAPLLAFVALVVKLTSPGPAFFGHLREGRGGRPFRCWKFRTMYVGADAAQRELVAQQQLDGPQFKMAHDPRVTPVGRWLRATNLDELPQLLNVALGQMSFVGPRPSPFRENQICVPWRHGRLTVRPGITGLWQVCRHDRDQGDFHQWIEYDLLYVRHASFLVDLKIIVATFVTLGGKRPAAVAQIIPAAADRRGTDRRTPASATLAVAPLAAPPSASSPRGRVGTRVVSAVRDRRAIFRRAVGWASLMLPLLLVAIAAPRPARAQLLGPFDDRSASGWQVSTGVGQTWADNLRFVQPDGPADMSTRTRVEASRLWRTPRGRLAVVGSGALVRFGQATDLNRSSYDVAVQTSRTLTRRTSGTLDYRAQSDLTSRTVATAGDGPLLAGLVAARTNAASGGLTWRATPLVSAYGGARYQDVSFSLPALVGGRSAGVGVGATVRQSRHVNLSADYDFLRSSAQRTDVDAHRATGSADYQLGKRVGVRLTAGVSAALSRSAAAVVPTRTRRDLSPVGGGVLRVQHRGGDGTLDYQRSLGQLFGGPAPAVFTNDAVGVAYRRMAAARLQLDAAARHTWSRPLGGAALERVRSAEVVGNVRYVLPAGFLLAAGAFWRQRDAVTMVSSRGMTVGLGYGWSQLRNVPVPQVDVR